jgi:hypothetical protein
MKSRKKPGMLVKISKTCHDDDGRVYTPSTVATVTGSTWRKGLFACNSASDTVKHGSAQRTRAAGTVVDGPSESSESAKVRPSLTSPASPTRSLWFVHAITEWNTLTVAREVSLNSTITTSNAFESPQRPAQT